MQAVRARCAAVRQACQNHPGGAIRLAACVRSDWQAGELGARSSDWSPRCSGSYPHAWCGAMSQNGRYVKSCGAAQHAIERQIMLNAAHALPPPLKKDGDPGKGTRWDPAIEPVPTMFALTQYLDVQWDSQQGVYMPNPRPILERFHEKYERVPFSGCWIWTHAKMAKGGYGRITFERGSQVGVGAHRVSWVLHNGPIPDGMWVLHRCDVPACVNPEHLFLGNASDNALDAVNKGRHSNGRERFMETFCGPICPRWLRAKRKSEKRRKGPENQKGTNNHNAKLDWDKVRDIRTGRMTMAAFARLYGVSHKTIRNITYGVKWVEDSPPT